VSVFIIINESTTFDDAVSSEIVGSRYFTSEQSAWEALRDIAHAHEDDLDYDSTSLTYEITGSYVSFEEYYIQELTKGEG